MTGWWYEASTHRQLVQGCPILFKVANHLFAIEMQVKVAEDEKTSLCKELALP